METRELKFRAWCRDGDWKFEDGGKEKREFEMIEADDLQTDSIRFSLLKDFLVDIEDDCYWMQYTGLNDKNGKEIYEGDIVTDEDGTNDVIVWGNEWQFHTKKNLDSSQSEFLEVEIEVIGNIHQNPELLN